MDPLAKLTIACHSLANDCSLVSEEILNDDYINSKSREARENEIEILISVAKCSDLN